MVSGRILLGAVAAGVGGAVLVAAVVLGRGGQSELMTRERLETEGGVLHARIELFMRPAGNSRFDAVFEPEVIESWIRFEDGSATATIIANHTLDGVLLGRSRGAADDIESETLEDGRVVSWPRPSGYGTPASDDISAEELAEVEARMRGEEFERVASLRQGTLRFVGTYPRPPDGHLPTPYEPAYPRDLDVVTMEKEWVFGPNQGQQRIRFQAILEDGSRVLIASRRFDYSLLPLSEWDAIEELVWGS